MAIREVSWDRGMSVGVVKIDLQHQQLLEMFNALSAAMTEGRGRDELGELLHGLADYALTHFATEEQLMGEIEYPAFDQHRARHQEFKGRILEFSERLRSGDVLLTSEVFTFLRGWIVGHILEEDARCKPYFEHAGLS
jgi:hemerythrin-like metal-binding protein